MNDKIEYFDLNIDNVLEHWTISFALREFIANAIDEQMLSNTGEIEIKKLILCDMCEILEGA
jgi:hypothetical protein